MVFFVFGDLLDDSILQLITDLFAVLGHCHLILLETTLQGIQLLFAQVVVVQKERVVWFSRRLDGISVHIERI